jgi:tripartite-type tricarboxylate transporter receptor subunit TctC
MSFLSRRALLASAGPALLPLPAAAQSGLPDRAIRIWVGFASGGGADVVARAITPAVQQRLGRPVTVENRPGAAGAAMGESLKKATPDGTTIGLLPSTTLIGRLTSPSTFPFDPTHDLAPLGIVGTFETAFVVSPSIGVRTMAEYVQWVKDGPPERRRFGTAAPETFSQYFAQLLGRQYDIMLEPVPFRGTGPLSSDLGQGRIPAGCGGLASFVHQHRGNKLRILTTSGPDRNPVLPDVPTVVELGFPKLQLIDWYAFFAPAGLPPRLIAVWNRELRIAVEMRDTRDQLTQYGVIVGVTKPDECAVRLASDFIRWRTLLDMLGIRAAN